MTRVRLNNFVFLFTIAVGWFLFANQAFAIELIKNFETDITISEDGSFVVEELIEYDFSSRQRHGIFRKIPVAHPQDAEQRYHDRIIDIEVLNVTLDGAVVPYTISESSSEYEIKIGDPNSTITGRHDYRISYKVRGGLSYYLDENPELYWDAVGTGWNVIIENVEVRVQGPEGMLLAEYACYQGTEGLNKSCESITATTSKTVFSSGNLAPGEGLTIAQALQSGKVERLTIERISPWFSWVPALVALFLAFVYWLYRIKTKHNPGDVIVAEYEPYPGLLPMFTGVLLDGQLDARDITAGILYLAEQGFIKITKTSTKAFYLFEVDDYEVELLKDNEMAPSYFHESLLGLLFDAGLAGTKVKLSEIKKDQSKARTNARKLQKLRTAVADDVVERGFYEQIVKLPYIAALIALLFAISVIGGIFFPVAIIVVVLGISIFAFVALAIVYRRRTKLGYHALNHIKGFKDFLSVTGEERFKFHNAPSTNPGKFLEYLPYAVALGVEKEWSEVFKDVTVPNPSWYDGGSSAGAFNAAALTSDLGAFSTAFASSSGSSSSGSSGGGSVGGGAGGGGGGSW